MLLYTNVVNLLIRPPRSAYQVDQLPGPKLALQGKHGLRGASPLRARYQPIQPVPVGMLAFSRWRPLKDDSHQQCRSARRGPGAQEPRSDAQVQPVHARRGVRARAVRVLLPRQQVPRTPAPWKHARPLCFLGAAGSSRTGGEVN
jgi:hypothetical protein